MKTETQEYEHVSTNSAPSLLAGIVIGGLAGAGAMLLLAPQSGKETRAQIQQKSLELRDRTMETVDSAMTQAKSKAHQISADVRVKAEEIQHQGQEVLVEQLDRVSAAVEAGKSAVKASDNNNKRHEQ